MKHLIWGGGRLLLLTSCRTQAKPTPVKTNILLSPNLHFSPPTKSSRWKMSPSALSRPVARWKCLSLGEKGLASERRCPKEKRKKGGEGTW